MIKMEFTQDGVNELYEEIQSCFQSNAPYTVIEAFFEIEQLTRIKFGLSVCRGFMLKHLGMKFQKLPASHQRRIQKKKKFFGTVAQALFDEEREGMPCVFCGCSTFCCKIRIR